ncbi:MAG TPA: response regulator [Bryobacteraceae bacterium]|nr:response regulator [Bryobacteraceae bacterium]
MSFESSISGAPVALVVDDDQFVLDAMCRVLERAGFEVWRAESPARALSFAARLPAVDILLCEALMPGMSGCDLARQVAGLHPEARCLFTAGQPDSPEITERIVAHRLPLLPKPFLPSALILKVREVLEAPVTQTAAGTV